MDFNNWVADVAAGTATHASGFTLKVEGNPADPSGVAPGKFPPDMSFVDQARLLRCGLEFLAKQSSASGGSGYVRREDDRKSLAIREREAQARRFAEQRQDKPQRSVLSLKRKTTADSE